MHVQSSRRHPIKLQNLLSLVQLQLNGQWTGTKNCQKLVDFTYFLSRWATFVTVCFDAILVYSLPTTYFLRFELICGFVFQPSYVFQNRPLTPPRFIKQDMYSKDLSDQVRILMLNSSIFVQPFLLHFFKNFIDSYNMVCTTCIRNCYMYSIVFFSALMHLL